MENNIENKAPKQDSRQIAGAIIVAGLLIAGAVLLRGSSDGVTTAGSNGARKLNPSVAKTIGLNTKEFSACLASGKFADKVQADIDDGVKAGVTGTPSSFIVMNGKVVETIPGAQPLKEIVNALDQLEIKNAPLPVTIRPISPDEHIFGNPNGKFIIVEYSDLECPYCKQFHATMHSLVAEKSNVGWVYRHYPIPQLHSKAPHESEASECAWEQGGNEAFWKYVDKIYQITPSNNGLDEKEL
ncbi:MAG: thioredoxin domain-containing protein [Candidatus Pacebacteria bacterium]|nr:thioredoxin domain-containing protein [Candidatus Paceibacterota bacterium]